MPLLLESELRRLLQTPLRHRPNGGRFPAPRSSGARGRIHPPVSRQLDGAPHTWKRKRIRLFSNGQLASNACHGGRAGRDIYPFPGVGGCRVALCAHRESRRSCTPSPASGTGIKDPHRVCLANLCASPLARLGSSGFAVRTGCLGLRTAGVGLGIRARRSEDLDASTRANFGNRVDHGNCQRLRGRPADVAPPLRDSSSPSLGPRPRRARSQPALCAARAPARPWRSN